MSGIQLIRSRLLAKSPQPLLSPGDPVTCFWPQLQTLGQDKVVQVDSSSPRSGQGPPKTQLTPAQSRDGYN